MNNKKSKIYLKIYHPKFKPIWNRLIKDSSNALFFHDRNYLEYNDNLKNEKSLLIFRKNICVAVFLANVNEESVYSFSGLTFGGLLLKKGEKSREIGEYLDLVINYYHKEGFKKLIYKPVPHIFHKYPCEVRFIFLMNMIQKFLSRLISYILVQRKNY